MRFLIENGTYGLWNVGDIVMLRVAARRIHMHFGDAQIDVVTRDAQRLTQFVDGVRGLAPGDWNVHYERSVMLRRAKRALRSLGSTLTRKLWRQNKELKKWVRQSGSGSRSSWNFISRLHQADAVIASGGGYITDDFLPDAIRVLRTFELAQRMGKKTAMFGQGFGPVSDPRLLDAARKVLPALDVIAVRDGLSSVRFLQNIGVDMARVVVTGDDAIEPASASAAHQENIIGVNVRVASYSGVDEITAQKFCQAVGDEAQKLGARIAAVGIGIHSREDDAARVKAWIPAASYDPPPHTLDGVMHAAGKCRLMVTGSFHAAVFALAQGVPSVAIVGNAYYADKFHGLAAQFGPALRIVPAADLPALRTAMHELWQPNSARSAELHAKTQHQITLSKSAYDKFFASL